MESEMPDITGNMIVLLGGMLAVGFFLNYGVTKNMFGGFNINLEGATASAVVLFFSVLLIFSVFCSLSLCCAQVCCGPLIVPVVRSMLLWSDH